MHVDGCAFKDIEDMCPLFKEAHHNLKLSLAADDVNPFGDMRVVYSMWSIFVINNNIPPWISIKKEHIIFSMIVPGIFLFDSYLN